MTARIVRKDIEGLRAIAVAAVVLFHAGVPGINGGYVGVDVFFVISGFLITSHLAEGLGSTSTVRFRAFYARRIRRILPASFLVILATFVGALIVLPPLQITAVVREATATAAYVPNILFALRGNEYLADPTPSPYQQYWSLGVEEQFYLLWPLGLLVMWKLTRGRRGPLLALLGAAVVGSFGLCLVMMDRSQPYAFYLLPMRAWELGVGGLLGLALVAPVRTDLREVLVLDGAAATVAHPHTPATTARAASPVGAAMGWLGMAMIATAILRFDEATRFPGPAAALPVAGTALVIWFGTRRPPLGPAAALSVPPAEVLGRISYSVYLWHWPLLILGAAAVDHELSLGARLGLATLTIPISLLTYRWVEQPARTTSRLTTRPGVTIGLALGGTVVVIATVVGLGKVWELRDLTGGGEVAATPLSVPPHFTPFVPSNITPSLRDAEASVPVLYERGCHLDWPEVEPVPCELGVENRDRRIVLFGDSHAAQWAPALDEYARDHGMHLTAHTKASCPPADMPKTNFGVLFSECDEWKHTVIDLLNADPPDLIVLSGARGSLPTDTSLDPQTAWNDGLAKTLDALPHASQIAVIPDTPGFPVTPSYCLSAHLTDTAACGAPRSQAVYASWIEAERATTEAHGAAFIDMTDYLCTTVCDPVIGPYLAYRDRGHLSVPMSQALGTPLGEVFATKGISDHASGGQ